MPRHDDALYTLADTRQFPRNSPLPRYEVTSLAEHVDALLALPDREARVAKLADIARSCGPAYAEKLKHLYAEVQAKRAEREARDA